MKLTDDAFISKRDMASPKRASRKQIQASMNPDIVYDAIFDILAQTIDPELQRRIDVAGDPNTSPEELTRMADDPAVPVRRKVMQNPNTPFKVVKKMIIDEDAGIQQDSSEKVRQELFNAPKKREEEVVKKPVYEPKVMTPGDKYEDVSAPIPEVGPPVGPDVELPTDPMYPNDPRLRKDPKYKEPAPKEQVDAPILEKLLNLKEQPVPEYGGLTPEEKAQREKLIEKAPIKELDPVNPREPQMKGNIPQELKDETIISFLKYIKKLRDDWALLQGRITRYQNPRYVNTKEGPRIDPRDKVDPGLADITPGYQAPKVVSFDPRDPNTPKGEGRPAPVLPGDSPEIRKQKEQELADWDAEHPYEQESRGKTPSTKHNSEMKALLRAVNILEVKLRRAGGIWLQLRKVYGPEIMKNEEILWLMSELEHGGAIKTKRGPVPVHPKLTPDDEDFDPLPAPKVKEEVDPKKKKRKKKLTPLQQYDKEQLEKQRTVEDIMSDPSYKKKSQLESTLSAEDMLSIQEFIEQEEHELDALNIGSDVQDPTDEREAAGDNPAGTAASPMNGQRDTLSKEEIPGTGKIGQVAPPAPPAAPPGAPPTAPPSVPSPEGNIPVDEDGSENEFDMEDGSDSRPLSEVLDDLSTDVESIKQKLDEGETLMHEDSSGSPASPPSKIAVDEPAKKYWEKCFGEYGHDLSKDRLAGVIDIIDELDGIYGVELSNAQVIKLADYVTSRKMCAAEESTEFSYALDKILLNQMFKSKSISADTRSLVASTELLQMAINESPNKDRVMKFIADKMKMPKVKGQPDDVVKVDKLKDKADSDDAMLSRPAHLPMEVINSEKSGVYTQLTIEWDPDHDAARRSDNGMKHAVISFVKGLESRKEFKDIGFLGQIHVDEIDTEAGQAIVHFRTQKPADFPTVVRTEKNNKK